MKNIFNRLAAAWRNRKSDDIKVGDTVIVTKEGDRYFRDLREGHIAKVTDVCYVTLPHIPYYIVASNGVKGWVRPETIRRIETPKKPLNKLAVFASAVLFVTALIIAFMPSNSAADMGKAIACAAGLIGLGAVAYIFIYDPSTDRFCDAIDNANSLTENEDEWLGL